ncbi:MAG: hypothetical protein EXR76_18385 [Myxococcales bacterium]|nr:hypothetical protein [Myxococcales bacterium]
MTRSLLSIQTELHALFRGQVELQTTAEALSLPVERLRIYWDFVRGHVRRALTQNFPVLVGCLPHTTFEALFEEYFRLHPPPSFAFNEAAEAFVGFLEEREGWEGHKGLRPGHAALSRFEWELSLAFHAPVEVPAVVETPCLNPTLAVLKLPFAVPRFLLNWQAGLRDQTCPLSCAPDELSLIFRHPKRETACFFAATDDLLFALAVIERGSTAEVVAEEAGLPVVSAVNAMRYAVSIGLVLDAARD